MTVLSTDTAIDLGILGTTDNELLTVNTAGGSVQVNTNYLSSLRVGKAQATKVAVAIHDDDDVQVVLERGENAVRAALHGASLGNVGWR